MKQTMKQTVYFIAKSDEADRLFHRSGSDFRGISRKTTKQTVYFIAWETIKVTVYFVVWEGGKR